MGKSATPRLADFERQGLALRVVCACGHERLVRPAFLRKLYGPETRLYPFVLDELARRFTCSACHTREPPRLEVTRDAAAER
jgi:hypothetical protein